MKNRAPGLRWTFALAALFWSGGGAWAGSADKHLDLTWVDVEGGGATLMVTPAGESILVDTGYPGERDARRVQQALEAAGLERIDHLVITHFHNDHYGGLADIVKLLPVGTVYTRDLHSAPAEERGNPLIAGFQQAKVEKRVSIKAGDKLPLEQAKGAAPLQVRFVGMNETFVDSPGARANPLCKELQSKPADPSDNRNSVVMVLTFGSFRFFDGGDLTWNSEGALVCPRNRIGAPVDVFQIDHHGLDLSNNPVLVKTLAPRVVIVNNGPRKGGEPESLRTVKSTSSVQAVYQVHRNVRITDLNTAPELTANLAEACEGNPVRLSVDPGGKRYTVAVPSTKHQRTFATMH